MKRTEARDMNVLIRVLLKGTPLEKGILQVQLNQAFDEVSGMKDYVMGRYYDKGVYFCKVSSSIVRQELQERKNDIIDGMNAIMRQNAVRDIVFR